MFYSYNPTISKGIFSSNTKPKFTHTKMKKKNNSKSYCKFHDIQHGNNILKIITWKKSLGAKIVIPLS